MENSGTIAEAKKSKFGRVGRKKNNYFDMFVILMEYSLQAINYLEKVLHDFSPDEETLKRQMDEMHVIEHTADSVRHEIMAHLAKEFVTPIEREDIIDIANTIDDITDSIEDVLQKIYMYHISDIEPEALEFVDIIKACVKKLLEVYQEFESFHKSKTIQTRIIEVDSLEETADRLYLGAIRRIHGSRENCASAFSWSIIFDHMEKCCDLCEEAGNQVGAVIMKNS